jgi:hypothetical protein
MNALRISFLVATDVAMIALFVSLLAGCVTTPSAPSRNGDFVSHMASVESVARDRAAVRPVALPGEAAPTRPVRG